MAYVSAVTWGLGLPRFGIASSVALVSLAAVWLGAVSRSDSTLLWVVSSASRLSSGFLLGSTLAAMLLGHHYLTAPAMSIDPLKRMIGLLAIALGVRIALSAMGICVSHEVPSDLLASPAHAQTAMVLAARWGMGFVGTAIATFMTWKTAQIRSTQSATGILYIAMIFVLFGELTAMIIASSAS